jgi:hypothetical protein
MYVCMYVCAMCISIGAGSADRVWILALTSLAVLALGGSLRRRMSGRTVTSARALAPPSSSS